MISKNLLFFKVIKNGKIPIKNENYADIKSLKKFDKIDTNLYNVGLPCGPNNLIILDIDIKDDGLTEWSQYIKLHGEPLTVCQKTPSGGYHYLFLNSSSAYSEEETLLLSLLKNKSKYRNKGIDIRKGNGYIVCEPSTINNNKYEFIRHYKDNNFNKMPVTLLKWLLEFEKTPLATSIDNKENILILLNDNKINLEEILYNFKNENSREWVKITACIKNCLHQYNNLSSAEVIDIWDKWSYNKTNYDKKNNFKIWETLNLNINFNTILDEPLPYIKHYEPITKDISNIKNVEMNNNYIYDKGYEGPQMTQEIFNNYDTIIIKSTTGTGKTSNTAHFINNFLESEKQTINNTTYKIMSIVSRVSLAQQHIESFKKENIFLDSYENIQNYEGKNIVICINSILKYSRYKPEFFNNYIVYIDEISTFTRHLTHNNQLNNILKPVYITLMKIINNCKKIIVSEALINDNVFNIIEKRKHETKILIKNSFKKYDGIKAIQHNDENNFLNLDKMKGVDLNFLKSGLKT